MTDPAFIFAGCTQKSHVSARLGSDRIVYGSMSNVVIADDKRVIRTFCLGDNINVIACEYEVLLVGGCSGIAYILNGDNIAENDFKSQIEVVGFLGEGRVMLCTMDTVFICEIENFATVCRVKNEWMPTCMVAVDDMVFVGTREGRILVLKLSENLRVISNIKEHEDSIQDVKAVNIGGSTYIATSSQDETIKIWKLGDDINPLHHVQTLNGHMDWVYGVHWTERGDLLSSSGDCSIIYWERGEIWMNVMRLGGEKTFFNVFELKGFVIGQSRSGGFYKFSEGRLEHYISGHVGEINSIDWFDEFVLTASLDMTSRIFYKGMEVGRPQMHGYPLTSAKFLGDESLRLISAAQETILRIYEPTKIFCMCCKYAESNSKNLGDVVRKIRTPRREYFLDALTENCGSFRFAAVPAELSLTNEFLEDFEFESLSEQLLSTSVFNEIKKVYGHFFEVSDVAVSKKFIASCNKSQLKGFSGIFVWNKSFELVQYVEGHGYGIQKLAFSADGAYLSAASRDKTASVYEVEDGGVKLIRFLRDHKRIVWDCCFSQDSKYLATCSRDMHVFVYEAPHFEKKLSIKLDHEITSICFSLVSSILLAGLESGEIVIFEVCRDSLSICNRRIEHSKKVNVIKFNEDGSMYATGGSDGMLKIFSFSSGLASEVSADKKEEV